MKEDLFGSVPFNPVPSSNDLKDPFEMGEFEASAGNTPTHQELENAIGLLDKRLSEMKVHSFFIFVLHLGKQLRPS